MDINDLIEIEYIGHCLMRHNGGKKQSSIIMAELAELIKAVSDYTVSENKCTLEKIIEEIIDVHLMLYQLDSLICIKENITLDTLEEIKIIELKRKTDKLKDLIKNGLLR